MPGASYDYLYHMSKSARLQAHTSLKPDPGRVLRSLGQDSSPAARTATTNSRARGGACRHGGIRTALYTVRGASRSSGLHSSSSSQENERSAPPCCLIPSYHNGGSTLVLPAAEPKGPLTLVRPCVRCCSALWAWCSVHQHASYEKRRHPDGLSFFSKRVMAACVAAEFFL